jgi:5'-nucleotidase
VKKFIGFAVVAALAVVAGCAKKTTTPAASASITEVAPPPPIHNGITPAQPISAIGYSESIAAPADDIAPAGPSRSGGAGKAYTVKKGDTLWGIAQRTYGDGKQYRKILAANPNIKGDKLNAGQKIVLPS